MDDIDVYFVWLRNVCVGCHTQYRYSQKDCELAVAIVATITSDLNQHDEIRWYDPTDIRTILNPLN